MRFDSTGIRKEIAHRVTQVRYHAQSRGSVAIPENLDLLLREPVRSRFTDLSSGDQRHLIDVATLLEAQGGGTDLVTAGLIHDIGKSVPGIRIHIPERIAKVLIEQFAPSLLDRIATRRTPPRLGAGIWVLCRHAATGSSLARQAGYNDRVCWLVANHERHDLSSDPDLAALRDADNSSFSRQAR